MTRSAPVTPAPAPAPPVASPAPPPGPQPGPAGQAADDGWWRTGVVYQIYPRSFADHDGDGYGDLPGIIEHLDHLNDGTPGSLGVDAIWLSPIYPSPGLDIGYDVSDYLGVDPRFGTLADMERLVAEAHRRGMKVILDMVLNHSSDAHPWFVASRAGRDDPFADWYIWRDPAGRTRDGKPRVAEQLGLLLRRPGLDLGRGPPAVLHAHVPARATRLQLAQPGRPGGPPRRHPDVARPGHRRPPLRRLQRLLQAPRRARQPPPDRARAARTAGRTTASTRTSRSCTDCWPRSGPSSTRSRGG